MSSDSGLKQRKVATAATSGGGGGGDSRFNDAGYNSEKENTKSDDGEEFDADSKEARLTLMEEILLLGLKDREVHKIN